MTFEILRNRAVFCPGSNSRLRITAGSAYSAFCGAPQKAEFERNLIRERTLAGLKAARARGRNGGRPKKLSPKELKTIRKLLRSNEVPVQDIAAQFKVNRSTLYRNVTAT